MSAVKQEIEDRLDLNIKRVKNLVSIYRTYLSGGGSGRRSHQQSDVLRAAVVLLHASMEDVLRSLAYWKLPLAAPAILDGISFVGGTSQKISLGSLSSHRGKSVDTVIKESVNASLERSNYNNTTEVSSFLISIGINVALVSGAFPVLDIMMARRHQIVHRADIGLASGSGNHRVSTINPVTLDVWILSVETFARDVLAQV